MTTATIAQVIDKLATLQKAIEGVKAAFGHNQAPDALRPAMLPCFVSVPGEAEPFAEVFARSAIVSQRTYRMLLYVCPVSQPSEVAKQADLVEPFFDRVLAKFKAEIDLDGLEIVQAQYLGDAGLDVLEYAGQLYAGIEFRLRVDRQL